MAPLRSRRRIVVIGGGNGTYINGVGLVNHDVDVTLLCPPADSGGSTGRLRGEHGEILPPGDLRRGLVALMRDPEHRKFFGSRFPRKGRDVDDHSIGNLIIDRAQDDEMFGAIGGIRYISKTFGVEGTVLPMSFDPTHLKVMLQGGATLESEHLLDTRSHDDDRAVVGIWLQPRAFISRDAAEELRNANDIVLSFSDLYSSLLAALKVKGVREAILTAMEAGAKVYYELPLMSKKAETDGYRSIDFVKKIMENCALPHIHGLLVNSTPPPSEILEKYWEKERARPIKVDWGSSEERGQLIKKIYSIDLLSRDGLREGLIRHDSTKLARAILDLSAKGGWF